MQCKSEAVEEVREWFSKYI